MLFRLRDLIIGDGRSIKAVFKSMERNGIKRDLMYPYTYEFPHIDYDSTYSIYIDKDSPFNTFYLLDAKRTKTYLTTGSLY